MDLFPDGGFVRLRSRARDKYVHADEDEASVCLRPLGSETSMNAVWKVDFRPVEGGRNLLLQGAAYGRYLAIAKKERQASSSHHGVRVLQRDYTGSEYLDPSCVWTPHKVEAGKNYVRLHNDEKRCLRANGNLLTADAWNGDETTMMQWRVEAIPLPPPRRPPCCCACGREGSAPLCRRCAASLKTTLLDAAEGELKECAQRRCYCLECSVFADTHTEHKEKTILLGRYKGHPVAWLTGEEPWADIFKSIETTQDRALKPYLLYTPNKPRCKTCRDIVSTDDLYGVLTPYCTLQCFAAGDGAEGISIEKTIVATDYSGGVIGFCLTCAAPIPSGGKNPHQGQHDLLSTRTTDCMRPRLLIPDNHPKTKTWATIKKASAGTELLIRDNDTARCSCGKRLASPGSCSLQCFLEEASREAQFIPRPVCQQRHTTGGPSRHPAHWAKEKL